MGVMTLSVDGLSKDIFFEVPLNEDSTINFDEIQNFVNYIFSQASTKKLALDNQYPEGITTVEESKEECAECARKRRDIFLLRTDYTQMTDSPLTDEEKAQAVNIRTQLRDIPSQAGFPIAIDWPAIPFISTEEYNSILNMDFCSCN